MPRVTASATGRPGISRPVAQRPVARPRVKKTAVPQDRLTARRLFFRRVKRSLRPGLWFMGVVTVLILASDLVHSLPAMAPPQVEVRQSGSSLANLAADLGLRISKIEVLGAQATDAAALRAAIGVQPGIPSLGFSLTGVQERVEQLGPVQSATVQRVLPGTLIVTIKERDAYAIWQSTGPDGKAKFLLIDRNGNVITDQDAAAAKRREPSLLLLTGTDAPANAQNLVTELSTSPAVLFRVAAAERVDGLRWNLVLKNQTLVKLPDTNEQAAIAELAALQSSMQLLDRPVEVIDLRLSGRLVVRPYPAPNAEPSEGHA